MRPFLILLIIVALGGGGFYLYKHRVASPKAQSAKMTAPQAVPAAPMPPVAEAPPAPQPEPQAQAAAEVPAPVAEEAPKMAESAPVPAAAPEAAASAAEEKPVETTAEKPAEATVPAPPGEVVLTPVAPPADPKAGIVPSFALMDVKGNRVTEKDLPKKMKLVFFGFTRCPDICPTTLQKFSDVMEDYDSKGEKVVPVFITVDPDRDTGPVIEAYLKNFNPHIVGLTGSGLQVQTAQSNYKAFASVDGDKINHSGYVYLLSPDNKLLEIINGEESADGIIDKIKLHQK